MVSTTKNARKPTSPARCQIPLNFLLKKWSIWRLLGLRVVPRHSKRFRDLAAKPRSEISRSGKVPNSFKLLLKKCSISRFFGLRVVPRHPQDSWAPKPWKNIRFLLVLWHFVKELLYFLRFFLIGVLENNEKPCVILTFCYDTGVELTKKYWKTCMILTFLNRRLSILVKNLA